MPKKKTTKPDDALALLPRRKESRDAERERRKADADYQAEWRDAWLATVATDPERLPPHMHHDDMVHGLKNASRSF